MSVKLSELVTNVISDVHSEPKEIEMQTITNVIERLVGADQVLRKQIEQKMKNYSKHLVSEGEMLNCLILANYVVQNSPTFRTQVAEISFMTLLLQIGKMKKLHENTNDVEDKVRELISVWGTFYPGELNEYSVLYKKYITTQVIDPTCQPTQFLPNQIFSLIPHVEHNLRNISKVLTLSDNSNGSFYDKSLNSNDDKKTIKDESKNYSSNFVPISLSYPFEGQQSNSKMNRHENSGTKGVKTIISHNLKNEHNNANSIENLKNIYNYAKKIEIKFLEECNKCRENIERYNLEKLEEAENIGKRLSRLLQLLKRKIDGKSVKLSQIQLEIEPISLNEGITVKKTDRKKITNSTSSSCLRSNLIKNRAGESLISHSFALSNDDNDDYDDMNNDNDSNETLKPIDRKTASRSFNLVSQISQPDFDTSSSPNNVFCFDEDFDDF